MQEDTYEALRRTWEGQTAYSEEFDAVVTVQKVHDPLDPEDDDEPVAVDVWTPDNRLETTDLDGLRGNAVERVHLDADMSAQTAHELLGVLEAGIEAVEAETGERAERPRQVRKAIHDQHKRIDNSLTTRQVVGDE